MKKFYLFYILSAFLLFSLSVFATSFSPSNGTLTYETKTASNNIQNIVPLVAITSIAGIGGFLLSNKRYLQGLKSSWFSTISEKTIKIGNLNIFSSILKGGDTLFGISYGKEIKSEFRIDVSKLRDSTKVIETSHLNIKNIPFLKNFNHLGLLRIQENTNKVTQFFGNCLRFSQRLIKDINGSLKDLNRIEKGIKIFKNSGKVLIPLAIALDAYFIYNAFKRDGNKIGENTIKEVGSSTGGWIGAIVGGIAAGAAAGAVFGGVGAIPGAIIGGIAGAIIGSGIGEKVALPIANTISSFANKISDSFKRAHEFFSTKTTTFISNLTINTSLFSNKLVNSITHTSKALTKTFNFISNSLSKSLINKININKGSLIKSTTKTINYISKSFSFVSRNVSKIKNSIIRFR
ncbi:MAG: hypothetical protein QXF15_00330 [Candidatus Aenigmatarchaeota archaeon]